MEMRPSLAQSPRSGLSLASMICGIFAIPTCGAAGIAGAILGHLGLSDIKKSGGTKRGKGMAVTGLILSYLSLLTIPIAALAGLSAPMILKQRAKAEQVMVMTNMKMLGITLMEFEQKFGSFPSDETAPAVATATKATFPMTGSDVLRQLEANGDGGLPGYLAVHPSVAKGDWYYQPGLDLRGNPKEVVLISPAIDGKVAVLHLDQSVTKHPESELPTLRRAGTFIPIPATRREKSSR